MSTPIQLDASRLKASYLRLAEEGTDADQRRDLWVEIRKHFPGLAETMWEQYQALETEISPDTDAQRQRIGGALFMLLAIAHAMSGQPDNDLIPIPDIPLGSLGSLTEARPHFGFLTD